MAKQNEYSTPPSQPVEKSQSRQSVVRGHDRGNQSDVERARQPAYPAKVMAKPSDGGWWWVRLVFVRHLALPGLAFQTRGRDAFERFLQLDAPRQSDPRFVEQIHPKMHNVTVQELTILGSRARSGATHYRLG